MSNAGGAPGASTSASGEYRPGVDAALSQDLLHPVARGTAPGDPDHGGRLLLVGGSQLPGLLDAEPPRPALDEPAWMRGECRDVPDGIGLSRGRRRWRSVLRQAPQHRVRVPRRARQAQCADQLHPLVHCRARGHAGMVQQLESGHPQRRADRRIELGGRARAVRCERAVQLQLPAQRSVRQLGAERRFAGLDRTGRSQSAIQRQVGEGAALLDSQEHLGRQPARSGNRHSRASTAPGPFASTGAHR